MMILRQLYFMVNIKTSNLFQNALGFILIACNFKTRIWISCFWNKFLKGKYIFNFLIQIVHIYSFYFWANNIITQFYSE